MKFAQCILCVTILQCVLSNPIVHYKALTKGEAERLAAWTPESKKPMWQLSGQYQGDMVLQAGQRNGVIDRRLRWPSRVIRYEFSNDFTEAEKQYIAQSLATEYAKTCITVRPRKAGDLDYVYITGDNTGCWSYVGRVGGRQLLNLQRNGCVYYHIIVHEFLHAAGFYHQHSATDRDEYVTIFWQNIIRGQEHAFDKYPNGMISSFGEKYDYGSIMHYDPYAFSSNGQPTILPKDPNAIIGQTNYLSKSDIIKLNKMYNCV